MRPVGIFSTLRLTVLRGNRRLNRERAWATTKCLRNQRQRFGNLRVIPKTAILLFENHQIARLIQPCSVPGILKQHECEESGSLSRRFGPYQCPDETRQPDRLGTEIGSGE